MTVAVTGRASPWRRGPDGLPRLLTGCRTDRSMGLDEHLHQYGPPPWRGTQRHGGPLIGSIEASGLGGRGGAAFQTGRKWRAVAQQRGRAVVVVNGSEGEALSAKDELLLTRLPHVVLDGAALAAEAPTRWSSPSTEAHVEPSPRRQPPSSRVAAPGSTAPPCASSSCRAGTPRARRPRWSSS
jgi:hypothetical protein